MVDIDDSPQRDEGKDDDRSSEGKDDPQRAPPLDDSLDLSGFESMSSTELFGRKRAADPHLMATPTPSRREGSGTSAAGSAGGGSAGRGSAGERRPAMLRPYKLLWQRSRTPGCNARAICA